ncbi:hypothetical protein HYT56_00855 [Candidatus Woesearchaeota archaeon]|nr:hypothetical protein [Candidatus Woesearchaeota archaeon]
MLKLLGILDLAAAVLLVLIQWDIGLGIASFLAGYLVAKSLIFISDWVSWIDLLSGLYMFLSIYDIHSAFTLIFVLWLLQKSFFSLMF